MGNYGGFPLIVPVTGGLSKRNKRVFPFQIVHKPQAFLSNFHPALVPCSSVDDTDDCDVDEYFNNLCPETDDDSFSD